MAARPQVSEGARIERKALVARLVRRIRHYATGDPVLAELQENLKWVQTRQKRYDRKPGGLGRR